MGKKYNSNLNVYDASVERVEFIFKNFEKIYLSFSGGKDSGVMLNLVVDYMKANNITDKIGVMIMDNEANYNHSLDFMHRIIQDNIEYLDVYWCCLPITLPCTVSSYATDWQCWGVEDEANWVKPMPKNDYIVNINNHNMPFFRENMGYDEFWDKFGDWYAQGERCACLIGIRTDESLNRYRAIMNDKKGMIDGLCWTKKNTKFVYNCYPIYDWRTDDVWIANLKFDWDYNKLYDIFYRAGLTVAQMRVASPFMSEAKSSLNLYRVIDPEIWSRLCARVSGANFMATYGKQISYNSFKLPEGHTWKSFTKFLIDTLPEEVGENFKKRFAQSIKYWWRVGRGLSDDLIKDLVKNKIDFKLGEKTKHGRKDKTCVRMIPPDHLDMLRCHNSDVTSWKRFALTILKNDHTCKYLGLAPTIEQAVRQKTIQKKYKNLPIIQKQSK
jgi:predicted phosphoadenosine phosphosulfate sulfurtransferase|tara:strand:- start:2447 stop:3769 length:1323 start_codon:yes stop_codon:yes gene_type:complete